MSRQRDDGMVRSARRKWFPSESQRKIQSLSTVLKQVERPGRWAFGPNDHFSQQQPGMPNLRPNGSQKAKTRVAVTIDDLPAEIHLQILGLCSPDEVLNLISASPRSLAVFREYRRDLIRDLVAHLRGQTGFPKVDDPKDHDAVLQMVPYASAEELLEDLDSVRRKEQIAYRAFSWLTLLRDWYIFPNWKWTREYKSWCKQWPEAWAESRFPTDLPTLGVLYDLMINLHNSWHRLPPARVARVNHQWLNAYQGNVMLYLNVLLSQQIRVGKGDTHAIKFLRRIESLSGWMSEYPPFQRPSPTVCRWALNHGWVPGLAGPLSAIHGIPLIHYIPREQRNPDWRPKNSDSETPKLYEGLVSLPDGIPLFEKYNWEGPPLGEPSRYSRYPNYKSTYSGCAACRRAVYGPDRE